MRAVADTQMDIRSAARHEAGHAVMAIAMGYKVIGVIVRADGTGGTNAGPGRGRRRDPFAEALICWGGCIADGTAQAHIGEGDALIMRAMGYRWNSIMTLRDFAQRHYLECGLEPAVVAVSEVLMGRIGRGVSGSVIHETALRAVPTLVNVAAEALW